MMKIRSSSRLAMAFVLTGMAISQTQAADVVLDNDKKKFSYALGYQIAQNLVSKGALLDPDAFAKATQDAFSGKPPVLSADEIKAVAARIQKKALKKHGEVSNKNLVAGKKFLAENAKKEGVKTLDSGLQYKVLIEGEGDTPTASSTVVAHYEGRLTNGTVFDSSIKRGSPATFPVKGVIKGWQEALQLMPIGSKWQVYIPTDLAYGEKGAGGSIGPNEALVFDIELISIN